MLFIEALAFKGSLFLIELRPYTLNIFSSLTLIKDTCTIIIKYESDVWQIRRSL